MERSAMADCDQLCRIGRQRRVAERGTGSRRNEG
jgi:hypothetical protein